MARIINTVCQNKYWKYGFLRFVVDFILYLQTDCRCPKDDFPSDNFPSGNFLSGNFPKVRLGLLRRHRLWLGWARGMSTAAKT